MGKANASKLPSLTLLAALNILFIAMPLFSLLYATISVRGEHHRIATETAQGREPREKLADFYGPFAAMFVTLVLSLGIAVVMHRLCAKAYTDVRKYDPYARKPATMLLGMPGILVASGALLIVLLDFTVNQIVGEPSWIQRGIEKILSLT